jgi:hypothetical protein
MESGESGRVEEQQLQQVQQQHQHNLKTKIYNFFKKYFYNGNVIRSRHYRGFHKGTLTEREGSVQLTSSLR